jgi:selenocysteine lyase/cysteine desulfurase
MESRTQQRPLSPVSDDPRLRYLRQNVSCRNAFITTPFGRKRLRYFDYTAAGPAFEPIEEVIRTEILPYMANTHSEGNSCGHRMTWLVQQARKRISECLGATDQDVVLFTGNGSTGAINHLIQVMGLRVPDQVAEFCGCRKKLPLELRPMVFRSRMEHHSNDISWRETLSETRFVSCDGSGRTDWRDLERQLRDPEALERPVRIGTFSAASNVTGIINDVDALARTMHEANGFAFFDYAAAAPYLPVDLHPGGDEARRKDAVFLSTHKFIGGPQTPGILAANRALFTNRVPVEPGGGTVLYTSPWDHRYFGSLELREEGGTPPIVQIIRAGLVFQLRSLIGPELIRSVEHEIVGRAKSRLLAMPGITILGNTEVERLGMFSVIFCGGDLHYKLAVRLLSDVYGIQVRSGCMCAGTYGHDLLDISEEHSRQIRSALDMGDGWAKPGWVRISLSPATSPEDLEFMLDSVEELAASWRKYESLYRKDDSGEFVWSGSDYTERFGEPGLSIPGR